MKKVDVAQVRRILADAEQAMQPDKWTGAYVGQRFVEAYTVLDRLPVSCFPAGFRSPINFVVRDEEDAKAAAELADAKQFNWSRAPLKPRDISRMERTFAWITAYLASDPDASRCLQCWAVAKARRLDLGRLQRLWKTPQNSHFQRLRLHAALTIAAGLARDHVHFD